MDSNNDVEILETFTSTTNHSLSSASSSSICAKKMDISAQPNTNVPQTDKHRVQDLQLPGRPDPETDGRCAQPNSSSSTVRHLPAVISANLSPQNVTTVLKLEQHTPCQSYADSAPPTAADYRDNAKSVAGVSDVLTEMQTANYVTPIVRPQQGEAVTQTEELFNTGSDSCEIPNANDQSHTPLTAILGCDYPSALHQQDSSLHPTVDMHGYCYCCYKLPQPAFPPMQWPPQNSINMLSLVTFTTAFHELMVKSAAGTAITDSMSTAAMLIKATIPSRIGHGRCYCCYSTEFIKLDPLQWPPVHQKFTIGKTLETILSDEESDDDHNYTEAASPSRHGHMQVSPAKSCSPVNVQTTNDLQRTDSEIVSNEMLSRIFASPPALNDISTQSPETRTILRSPDESHHSMAGRKSSYDGHKRSDTPFVGLDCFANIKGTIQCRADKSRPEPNTATTKKRKIVEELNHSHHPSRPKRSTFDVASHHGTSESAMENQVSTTRSYNGRLNSSSARSAVRAVLPVIPPEQQNLSYYENGRIKTWFCDLCDQHFPHNSSFVRHYTRFHVPKTIRPYFKFKTPSERLTAFSCPVAKCDYSSKQLSDRKAHLIGVHECEYFVTQHEKVSDEARLDMTVHDFRNERGHRGSKK